MHKLNFRNFSALKTSEKSETENKMNKYITLNSSIDQFYSCFKNILQNSYPIEHSCALLVISQTKGKQTHAKEYEEHKRTHSDVFNTSIL